MEGELIMNSIIGLKCLICDNIVDLEEKEIIRNDFGLPIGAKVCDECKKAVTYAKYLNNIAYNIKPVNSEQDIRCCDKCKNYTDDFNNEVDNGYYMCSKGLENNYEPIEDEHINHELINETISMLENMYDKCRTGTQYNDPDRDKKADALAVAIEIVSRDIDILDEFLKYAYVNGIDFSFMGKIDDNGNSSVPRDLEKIKKRYYEFLFREKILEK